MRKTATYYRSDAGNIAVVKTSTALWIRVVSHGEVTYYLLDDPHRAVAEGRPGAGEVTYRERVDPKDMFVAVDLDFEARRK